MIYILKTIQANFVKIGFCAPAQLASRIDHLQVGCPYDLLLVAVIYNGNRFLESQLHKEFKCLHTRGEWFRYEGPIVRYVEANPIHQKAMDVLVPRQENKRLLKIVHTMNTSG